MDEVVNLPEPFTQEELDQGQKILAKMGAHWRANGRVPKELFFAYCLHALAVAVELLPWRRNAAGILEVLLVRRKDEYYDGWHIPGTIQHPGEKAQGALSRIIERELGPEVILPSSPRFLLMHDTMKGDGVDQNVRGQEVKRTYACFCEGVVREGTWFPFDCLPTDIIPEHQIVLPWAIHKILATCL